MWLQRGHPGCPTCAQPLDSNALAYEPAVVQWAQRWANASGQVADAPQATAPTLAAAPESAAFKAWLYEARRNIFLHPPECPISAETLTDAVTTSCGHSFQRQSLLHWLDGGHPSCPCCRAHVTRQSLRKNSALDAYAALWEKAGSPQAIPAADAGRPTPAQAFSQQALGMPGHLLCALSRVPLRDPVAGPCGHVFERSSIEGALQLQGCCPIDNQVMGESDLRVHHKAAQDVVAWQTEALKSMSAQNWRAIYFAN
jgi:hypothetical protein